MRVLLVSANTEQINMPVLPVGLAAVAAAAEARGHRVKLLNLMCGENPGADVRQAVVGFQPEVIGISVRNIDNQVLQEPKFMLAPVRDMVTVCRKHSSAPIVLGGAGYTLFPREALNYLAADLGMQGEGEEAFGLLLDALAGNGDLERVPGLYRAGEGQVTPRRPIRRLDDFPMPMKTERLCIPRAWDPGELWIPVQTRRGCPMRCSYCSTAAIEGRLIRKRSPGLVVESLQQAVDAGLGRFFFVDNTFNLPPSYAKSLCKRMLAAKLAITWRCIVYPWKVDEEMVRALAKAGCTEVAFGFESGSEPVLYRMGKRYRPAEVRRIASLLKRYGIRRMGFLLLGGPGETTETVLESLRFADSLRLEAVKVTVGIRIYPHTRLAKIAREEGVIAAEDELLYPVFYLAEPLRDWLPETVGKWLEARPNWMT